MIAGVGATWYQPASHSSVGSPLTARNGHAARCGLASPNYVAGDDGRLQTLRIVMIDKWREGGIRNRVTARLDATSQVLVTKK